MNVRWLVGRSFRVLAAPLVLAGALIGIAPGAASASSNCVSWTGVQPTSPSSTFNELRGVAVLSSCNAWAVGDYFNGTADQTLIEHWNGSAWARVSSPNPGGSANDNYLFGVAATSASNAWAVGTYFNGTANQTLIEHWNGTSWKHVSSPDPGGSASDNELGGVAATSASNAWAVGHYFNGAADQTLIEHWNGTSWKHVSSPDPSGSSDTNILLSVAATSSSNAWAVGYYFNIAADQTLIEHWNGTSWKHVSSPDPGGSANTNLLIGVATRSASNAWAVGSYYNGTAYQTLAIHCC
jgi:hypothetical protein